MAYPPDITEPDAWMELTPNEDEEDFTPFILGKFRGAIVGIRYYKGEAHPGEYVTLEREPYNPYDNNAIRVDNLRHEKVGHIKRQQAAILAPIMDAHGDKLQLDATIPYRGDQYTLPIEIELSSSDVEIHALVRQFRSKKNFNFVLNPELQTHPDSTEAAPSVRTRTLDWRAQQKDLDDMFEKQAKDQLTNLPVLPRTLPLVTDLLEHQALGIRWMAQRENCEDPPPFFRQVIEGGKKLWLCEITQSSNKGLPKPVHGGILAGKNKPFRSS